MADKPHIEEVEVDPKLDPQVQVKIIEAERKHARRGQIIGLIVIVLGAGLTLLGATGAVDMRLGGLGFNVQVANAAPGVVATIVGLVIIWRTSLRIKTSRTK